MVNRENPKAQKKKDNLETLTMKWWNPLTKNNPKLILIITFKGGWNDALVAEEGDRDEYLKLMSMYTMVLSQAEEVEEEIIIDLPKEDLNSTEYLDIEYEYVVNVSINEIQDVFKPEEAHANGHQESEDK